MYMIIGIGIITLSQTTCTSGMQEQHLSFVVKDVYGSRRAEPPAMVLGTSHKFKVAVIEPYRPCVLTYSLPLAGLESLFCYILSRTSALVAHGVRAGACLI